MAQSLSQVPEHGTLYKDERFPPQFQGSTPVAAVALARQTLAASLIQGFLKPNKATLIPNMVPPLHSSSWLPCSCVLVDIP